MDLQDQMRQDHDRDYASRAALDKLRTDLHAFLNDPAKTHQLRANTREVLREACVLLKADSDHVTAVWD